MNWGRMRLFGFTALLVGLLLSIAGAFGSDRGAGGRGEVWVVPLDGPLGPASANLIIRSIGDAEEAGARALVIRMNTPGGLDQAMRDVVQAILAANVPVITYVAPDGARAASAGTYIAYASHIAAMSPATNLGSATPVTIGGGPGPGSPGAPPEEANDADDVEGVDDGEGARAERERPAQ
ncbi:MAG: hypothetical protein ACNA7W_15000 [Pseudomonadales bacterium]